MHYHQVKGGLLLINKPSGMVSKDISRALSPYLSKMKIGHVGTLDPMAEGLLPIVLGPATRLQDYLLEEPKTYLFELEFGRETDTLDQDGEIIKSGLIPDISLEDLRAVGETFLGEQLQAPPIYSAVKYKGKPLYRYAREGKSDQIDLQSLSKRIHITQFDILEYKSPKVTIEARCSKGTFVRCLAKDFAEKFDTCATVVRILRKKAIGYDLNQAFDWSQLLKSLEGGADIKSLMIKISDMKLPFSRVNVGGPTQVSSLLAGQAVFIENCPEFDPNHLVLLVDHKDAVIGLGAQRSFQQFVLKRSLVND